MQIPKAAISQNRRKTNFKNTERQVKLMITKEMSITEVVEQYPESAEIFIQHGMHCLGCIAAQFENIDQGARAHGIDVDALVEDLNAYVNQFSNKTN
jgi:hybrid cluster-associated redox disulfide protein